jgi:choline dehydrogenase-like flavoprotein
MFTGKHDNLLIRLARNLIPPAGLASVPPEEILRNIRTYVEGIRSPMSRTLQEILNRLIDVPVSREALEFLMDRPNPLRGLLIPVFQLIYLGFYSDARAYTLIGYTPFENRHPKRIQGPHPPAAPLPIRQPDRIIETDVCIIGSGAAGGVLAHALSAHHQRQVLVVEQGPYLQPAAFTNREPEMVSRLYFEGGLQLTLDFGMHILQGACVGGSTLVNNAICFRLFDVPEGNAILDRWEGMGAPFDRDALKRSYEEVANVIQPVPISEARMNRGAKLLEKGFEAWRRQGGAELASGRFHVNFEDCLGAGYCNIGCRYNRKRSTLLTYLPRAAATGRMQILPECRAERILRKGDRATEIRCRRIGNEKPASIRIKAQTVVVAAGTIASSALLLRSGIFNPRIGRGIGFNAGGFIHARFSPGDFPEGVNSFDGIQMCNYIRGPAGDYYIESIFNPPMAHALSVPGWFDDHFEQMKHYPFFATAGVIVGTQPAGELVPDLLLGGHRVNFAIDHGDGGDWQRLCTGLRTAAEIFLAAGAESVLPSAGWLVEIRNQDDLAKLNRLHPSDLYHGSSHPQGGNAMSDRPGEGVVNRDFQVIDWNGKALKNLYVCDASVFPTPIGINPQWTVMALADYAVRRGCIE